MREAFVVIDDVNVFRGYHCAWKGGRGVGTKYCAICEEEIMVGEEVSLLMNNYKLFPNVWVHDCHIDFDDVIVDTVVANIAQHNVVQTIVDKYRQFEKCLKGRKIWGNL